MDLYDISFQAKIIVILEFWTSTHYTSHLKICMTGKEYLGCLGLSCSIIYGSTTNFAFTIGTTSAYKLLGSLHEISPDTSFNGSYLSLIIAYLIPSIISWNFLLRIKVRVFPDRYCSVNCSLLYMKNHSRKFPFLLPPPDFRPNELKERGLLGTCEVQICRSAGPWSLGTSNKIEHSIQDAYLKGNVFFVTWSLSN
jgi:hypothetical protein